MNSNITIHVVEPGSDLPVPDTGLFTHGVGGKEAAIITIFSLAIIASLFAIYYYHKKHKQAKKHSAIGLFILALLASLGTFTAFILNSSQSNISAVDLDEQSANLIVDAEDTEITVELDNEPVFAYVPVKVTVPKATESGYTLKAYSEHPTLSSDTTDKTIDLITIPEDGSENANTLTTALLNNTWGLSLEQPTSQDNQIYYSLPNNLDDAIVIKSIKDTTPANDETIVYYGFYITPDTPYGTYTGATVSYEVEENVATATVIYNSNGLYFNDDESQTTNIMKYLVGVTDNTKKYSHTPNIDDEGIQDGTVGYHDGDILNQVVTIPGAAKIKVQLSYGGGYISNGYQAGFLSFWQGPHPNYTTDSNADSAIRTCGDSDVTDGKFYGDRNNENAVITVECEIPDSSVTFAYWTNGGGPSGGAIYGYYATVTGYDENGNIVHLQAHTPIQGEYRTPTQNLPYEFLGWSTDKNAAVATYTSAKDVELNLPLTNGETAKLYAIWQHATKITFDGNGADDGTGIPDKLVAAGQTAPLYNCNSDMNCQVAAYTRTEYAFTSWNTKPDGSGISYSEYPGFTAPAESTELILYAQWSPATTIIYDGNGGEGSQQRQSIRIGETSNILNNWDYFIKDGYIFSHWNTQPDGSGITYNPYDTFTASDQSEIITLYAQWRPVTTIIYDGNGAEWGKMGNETIPAGETWDLWDNSYSKKDYYFVGWNTQPDGSGITYNPYDTFTASDQSEIITLYAQWVPEGEGLYTTIIYNGNGANGGEMQNQIIAAGQTTQLQCNKYWKNGYWPVDWNTQPDGSGTQYDNCGSYTASGHSETIVLYAQWSDCPQYYICYYSNGADGKTSMENQRVGGNLEATLLPSNFSYTGHGFAGWSEDSNAASKLMDNDSNNNPIIYGPNQTITINRTSHSARLYAVWIEPAKDNNSKSLTFQTANLLTAVLSDGTTLASKPNGYVTALIDERDGQVYAVAKLADGNYWMIENLRLDNSAAHESTTAELSNNNTNNPQLPLINNYSLQITSNRLSVSSANWCTQPSEFCVNQSNINTGNITDTTPTINNPYTNIYSYGNYYNWYSATAGNGTYDMGSNVIASGDLCPAGWQLPYGGDGNGSEGNNKGNTSGGFYYLDRLINGAWQSFPNNFVYSGHWYGLSNDSIGQYGYYWSSTNYNANYAYYLYFSRNGVQSSTQFNIKRSGYSVRCLAKTSSTTSTAYAAPDNNDTGNVEATTPEEPLGEYQNSTTVARGTNIIIPMLIAVPTALGTSALVLLIYRSRHKEDE